MSIVLPFYLSIYLSTNLCLFLAEETSPPISMKSKIGLNFMVSVGRSLESGGENALAKLLQASQDFVSYWKCDFTMIPCVRRLVSWSVCHNNKQSYE